MPFGRGVRNSFPNEIRVLAEVDQQSQFVIGRAQIVEDLRPVFVCKCGHRLYFQDDLFEADKVRLVSALEKVSLISERQRLLWNERQLLNSELDFETLLVNRFQQAAAFFVINFKTS